MLAGQSATPQVSSRRDRLTAPDAGHSHDDVRVLLLTALLLTVLPHRAPATVLGGGLTDTDCTVAFGGVDATNGASGVVCRDGDAPCDLDAATNGACRFDVSLCRAVEADGCDPRSVTRVEVTGLSLGVPAAGGGPGVCSEPTSVSVPVGTAVGVTVLARDGDEPRDVDYLNLCCVDGSAPLDALRCALQVEPDLAGCDVRIPRKATRAFAKARVLADDAWRHGGALTSRQRRRIARQLAKVQDVGRRLVGRDLCGNTLALLARHALDILP